VCVQCLEQFVCRRSDFASGSGIHLYVEVSLNDFSSLFAARESNEQSRKQAIKRGQLIDGHGRVGEQQ
jgi:hypothetical protein